MNKLAYVLQNLPPEGRRLEGGLALQLHPGRDLTILDCSRIDQPPSEIEMRTVAEAVVEAYHPAAIWRGAVFVVESGGHNHHIWRLYWPVGAAEQVYAAPAREMVFPF
jgi:hypothetical protein